MVCVKLKVVEIVGKIVEMSQKWRRHVKLLQTMELDQCPFVFFFNSTE